MRGIVGFRLRVDRVHFKLKLGQNHPDANRRAVAERLRGGDQPAREVAGLMDSLMATAEIDHGP